jgi:hypothetical protein
MISPQRLRDLLDSLRRGTVPSRGLDVFAVGLERYSVAIQEDLQRVSEGGASVKCIRGEYGTGKTFLARWIQTLAKNQGFAVSEVQISETETPLHRLETVYRRSMERLATADTENGALGSLIDGWLYALEQDAIDGEGIDPNDPAALLAATETLMEKRLQAVTRTQPAYASALRAYHRAVVAGRIEEAQALVAWLAGQPNVAAAHKRSAGIKGDIDHFGALASLQGLLAILRDSGKPGLVLVLDEVETLQRVRGDVREKSLNALRQMIDEIDAGRYPGLYLLITGTPAFFDGPQGVQRLPPLAQRLHVDFQTDARFDNPRAVQIRLQAFDEERLVKVGGRIRDLYAQQSTQSGRILSLADDGYIQLLAKRIGGELGGRTGVAPRLFLRKLVGDVLDRIDQFEDFDPRRDYALTVASHELNDLERKLVSGVEDIDLDV